MLSKLTSFNFLSGILAKFENSDTKFSIELTCLTIVDVQLVKKSTLVTFFLSQNFQFFVQIVLLVLMDF